MNAEPLTLRQRDSVDWAKGAQADFLTAETDLRVAIKAARSAGVPILYLADALGVSRSRIRVLARDSER